MAAPTYNPGAWAGRGRRIVNLMLAFKTLKTNKQTSPKGLKEFREPMQTSFINRKMEENELLLNI